MEKEKRKEKESNTKSLYYNFCANRRKIPAFWLKYVLSLIFRGSFTNRAIFHRRSLPAARRFKSAVIGDRVLLKQSHTANTVTLFLWMGCIFIHSLAISSHDARVCYSRRISTYAKIFCANCRFLRISHGPWNVFPPKGITSVTLRSTIKRTERNRCCSIKRKPNLSPRFRLPFPLASNTLTSHFAQQPYVCSFFRFFVPLNDFGPESVRRKTQRTLKSIKERAARLGATPLKLKFPSSNVRISFSLNVASLRSLPRVPYDFERPRECFLSDVFIQRRTCVFRGGWLPTHER